MDHGNQIDGDKTIDFRLWACSDQKVAISHGLEDALALGFVAIRMNTTVQNVRVGQQQKDKMQPKHQPSSNNESPPSG